MVGSTIAFNGAAISKVYIKNHLKRLI